MLRRWSAATLVALAALLRRRSMLRAAAIVAIAIALPAALLLRARIGPRRTTAPRAPLFPAFASSSLLEFLHFALHELSRLRLLPLGRSVVSAIRAALPTFGIGFLAGGAEDALRQRHREVAAHCTLRAVEDRRKTLQTLISLAEGSSATDCWDDRRAESLLRSQSCAAEMRELGMSEGMIERVFGASDAQRGSFAVRVEARFEAAHFLREYRGVSEPLHGHSYKVEAELAARSGGIDSDAIAVDFVSARRKLEALAKRLDYGCINDVAPFDRINPSAENIAEWFWRELSAEVAGENALVSAVTVWEGPANSVVFRPQNLS